MVTALIITRVVHIAASMLLAGTFTFDLITLGLTDRSVSNDLNHVDRRLIRLALWSLITALLSALFWFWLEVASMSELSLKNALSAMAWGTVLFENAIRSSLAASSWTDRNCVSARARPFSGGES